MINVNGNSPAAESNGGRPLEQVSTALRRARELPWDAMAQKDWSRRFSLLVRTASELLCRQLTELEAGGTGPPSDAGHDRAELLRAHRELVADMTALADDTQPGRELSIAEFVAIYERAVMLESDVIRQQIRLGGTSAHDPRTVVGAACDLPRGGRRLAGAQSPAGR